jgi:glutamine synthetase
VSVGPNTALETGPGVYESALAYTDAYTMADNATLFKFIAKAGLCPSGLLTKNLTRLTVGMRHGIIPTFMAKPHSTEAGCSGHTHVSLRNATGDNIFAVKEARTDAKFDDLKWVSKDCEHFLAGVLRGLPDVVPCLLPSELPMSVFVLS